MSEIRKDYLTDTWVVIAGERSQRPIHRGKLECVPSEEIDPGCVFCPGNEHKTPPEIIAYRRNGSSANGPGWWLRCVPNKFPALRVEGDVNQRHDDIFNFMNGIGAHEVVIEMPQHGSCLATRSIRDVEEVFQSYKDRYVDLTRDRRFRYIMIFKNHGSISGASQPHPHSQIIAIPMIPKSLSYELEGARRYHELTGRNIFDDILEKELALGERIVYQNRHFVALCPFASRFPYETWIIPRSHDPSFEDFNESERWHLAEAMHKVLGKLYSTLGDPPYNYYIHTAPCDGNNYSYFRWHIEITPRLTETAGFERGTGFYINPLAPEAAAAALNNGKS